MAQRHRVIEGLGWRINGRIERDQTQMKAAEELNIPQIAYQEL